MAGAMSARLEPVANHHEHDSTLWCDTPPMGVAITETLLTYNVPFRLPSLAFCFAK
jgi:hypothetical protein